MRLAWPLVMSSLFVSILAGAIPVRTFPSDRLCSSALESRKGAPTVRSVIGDILRERELGETPSKFAEPVPPSVVPPPLPDLPPKSLAEISAEMSEKMQALDPMAKMILQESLEPISCGRACESLEKVRALFGQLKEIFFERDNLLQLLESTFIGKNSILILGPGGTAKSDVADRIGENVVDQSGVPSYFSLQLTQDTTAAETQGGIVVEEALKGRTVRNWMEGVLGSKIVFLDEFFDGRLRFLRSFLKAFNERVYTQGKIREAGKTEVFIAASNKYLNQVYEMFGNNDPQALVDRFQFVYYSPGVLQDTASILGLAELSRPDIAKLSFEDLDALNSFANTIPMGKLEVLRAQAIFVAMRRKVQAMEVTALKDYLAAQTRGERVQPPYKSTRVFSPRSLRLSFRLIRVQALVRLVASHVESKVQVEPVDVDRLMSTYLAMQTDKLGELVSISDLDPYEHSQLQTLTFEQDSIAEILRELQDSERQVSSRIEASIGQIGMAQSKEEERLARLNLLNLIEELVAEVGEIHQAEKISLQTIAALYGLRTLYNHPTTKATLQ